jgi:NADH-quinone oxidoreductase subunit M
MPDLSLREIAILAPIAFAVLWMGIYPKTFQDPMKPAVATVVARLAGREMATLPTDMTLSPGLPALVAPAHASEVEAAH